MSAHIICGGLTFEKTPVELREKVAFRNEQLPEALDQMKKILNLHEAVFVSTCNRPRPVRRALISWSMIWTAYAIGSAEPARGCYNNQRSRNGDCETSPSPICVTIGGIETPATSLRLSPFAS